MRHQYNVLFFSMLPLFGASSVFAGGFALNNQSIANSALAGAGGAVIFNDASTVFSNPAAMSQLPAKQQYAANLSLTSSSTSINDAYASTGGSTTAAGSAVTGTNDGNMTPLLIKPSAYMVFPLKEMVGYDNLMMGLGVFSPFGFNNNYEDSFQGRLLADKTKLDLYTMTLGLSAPVFDTKDFTFGFDYSRNRATGIISNALDTGDARTVISAKSKGAQDSYNFSLFGRLSPSINLGAKLTRKNELTMSGDINVKTPAQAATTASAATSTTAAVTAVPALPSLNLSNSAQYNVSTPKILEISGSYQINPAVISYLSYTKTDWGSANSLALSSQLTAANISSSIDTQLKAQGITLTADQLSQAGTNLNKKYGHPSSISLGLLPATTWAVGAAWQKTPVLTLRGGLALDDTATNSSGRNLRLPIGSSFTLGMGAGYKLSASSSIDVAYRFVKGNAVNVNQANADKSATYFGNIRNHDQTLAVQFNWGF